MNLTHTRLLLGSAAISVLSALAPMAADAQTPAPQGQAAADAKEEADSELEGVVVVGTNIAGVKPVGSEAVVFDSQTIERSGQTNAADLLRQIPQIQPAPAAGDQNAGIQGGRTVPGYNTSGTETVSIRGLGTAATLLLIDGRRALSSGAASTMVDANQLPLGAIQRIEILPDGASALYGSDAVAGVINYVLKHDYRGLEVFGRYANTSGPKEVVGGFTGGTDWSSFSGLGRGNILLSYEHQNRDNYRETKNPYLLGFSPLGGPDRRVSGATTSVGTVPNLSSDTSFVLLGIPGTPNTVWPQAGVNILWGVPAGDGTGLTLSSLRLNQPNLVDPAQYLDFYGSQRRDQVSLYANQTLTENLELYANVYHVDRATRSLSTSGSQQITLNTTPFMIAGLPGPPFFTTKVQYAAAKDTGGRYVNATSKSTSGTLGLKANLPADWKGEAYYQYGRNNQCDSCVENSLNVTALQAQANAGVINPLSSQPLTASQKALIYFNSTYASRTTLSDAVVKANGPLFNLPAGAVRAAVGAEYREDTNGNLNIGSTGAANTRVVLETYDTSRFSRNITSYFGEAYVPLISEKMDVPLVKNLRASAAVRYDDYSDVGDTTNPRFGLTWEVTNYLRFSGTWGKSFRAPSVTDSNTHAVFSASTLPLPIHPLSGITPGAVPPGFLPALCPFGCANVALLLGSRAGLSPETAENWSVNGVLQFGDFRFQASYYDIKYNNQIVFPGVLGGFLGNFGNLTAPPTYNGFGSLVTIIHNPVTCSNSNINSADPALIPVLQGAREDYVTGGFGQPATIQNNFCNINVIVDSRVVNLANTEQAGIDLSASYSRQVGDIFWRGQIATTIIQKNDFQATPGAAKSSFIGQVGQPIKVRANGSISAEWKEYTATLFTRYYGSYTNSNLVGRDGARLPTERIPDRTFFDLTLTYSHRQDEPIYGLKGWRAQVAVQDLFDKNLRFEPMNGGDANSFNRTIGVPMGRTFSFQLTADF